ncbi:glutamate-5-semialdehyde dehydrogenase [Chloroflexota bacterium]
MKSTINELEAKVIAAKAASRNLAYLSTEAKNKALHNIAEDLLTKKGEILAANNIDYNESVASGMSTVMLDRLMLDSERIKAIAKDVLAVAALPDPVGEIFDMRTLPNNLQIGRKRVPLGVIGAIYESRPNVTIDISILCLKSGNAIILRGGKEAIHSNNTLARVVQHAATRAGVPDGAIQFIDNTDRTLVNHLLHMGNLIDLMIPRGGAGLIKFITENAAMPVVSGGIGVCHTYVDRSSDVKKAVAIAFNAKVQRPTVCNALDTLLVHADIARQYLPLVAIEWAKAGVEMHCDEPTMTILQPITSLKLVPAKPEDWGKEFLSLVAAIKVVTSLDEALAHIEHHGSGHSEAIVTEEYGSAMRFLNEVDAACVYVNTSTRFTDGGQFGLGSEVGISTQKFHARGPLGLKELTTYKWIILGDGQVRP